MNESQDEDRGQRVREEQDPQGHIVAKGRQDPFVDPDESRSERKVRQGACGVCGLEPRTSAPNRDEGQQPRIHSNPREDRRTREVHRVAPRVRTRRTVTVSEGRHRHRVAPVSRSSAADRYPACRASASVMSERKARLASSMNRRPNSGPVSYSARTTSNRPFSKRRVWSSLSWFTLRIFTHWTRRWNAVSVTGSSRRWMIPSARNSSSSAVGGASREGSSEIKRLVTPRSRSHSKKPNVSARPASNPRTSSRAPHESGRKGRKFRLIRGSQVLAFRTPRTAPPRA